MSVLLEVAQAISIALFGWYGVSCFVSRRAMADFDHYRLPQLRVLTGALQIAGALGLVAGHFYRPLLLLSAGGLATMMALAVITRIRIRDPWYEAMPSFTLCLLNLLIVAAGWSETHAW